MREAPPSADRPGRGVVTTADLARLEALAVVAVPRADARAACARVDTAALATLCSAVPRLCAALRAAWGERDAVRDAARAFRAAEDALARATTAYDAVPEHPADAKLAAFGPVALVADDLADKRRALDAARGAGREDGKTNG